jgi:PSP
MKPGMLSKELKEALGMPDGAPPPWLINMQVNLHMYLILIISLFNHVLFSVILILFSFNINFSRDMAHRLLTQA